MLHREFRNKQQSSIINFFEINTVHHKKNLEIKSIY